MIDLHTHILPGFDDGAKDTAMSLSMLRTEWEQGVDTVVLTPHFYRYREEPEHFLQRRKIAFDRLDTAVSWLPADDPAALVTRLPGCEVAWVPNLYELDCLPQLCMANTRHMLLELPFTPWEKTLSRQLHDLMSRTGITPILAHLERYIKIQKPERMEEILSLGLPVQIGTDMLTGFFTRRQGLDALGDWAHIIASDCHNLTSRPPNLGAAMELVRKKLGEDAIQAIDRSSYRLAGITL